MKRLSAIGAFFEKNPFEKYLMPCALRMGFLANIALFYLGMAYVETPARQYGFMLLCGLFVLLCGLLFLKQFRQYRMSWWRVAFLALWLAFFVGNILSAYVLRPDGIHAVSSVKQFAALCLPAFLAGIIGARKKLGNELFETMEKLSFFVLPAGIIYFFGAIFNCFGFYGRDFGVLSYMHMAYGFAPVLISHMIGFQERKPWKLPLIGGAVRRAQLVRGLCMFVYWVDILASGTRGALPAVLGFAVFAILYRLVRREKVGRLSLLALAMVLVTLFLIFVYCPVGMRSGMERIGGTLTVWKNGEFTTAEELYTPEDYGVEENRFVELAVASPDDRHIMRRGDAAVISPQELDFELTPETLADINFCLGDRVLMYKIAWAEFRNDPLRGLGGAETYSYKYGIYPHCLPLEALCELGLVGVVLLLVVAYCLVKLFILGRRDDGVAQVLMLLSFVVIQYLINGSMWMCEGLQLAVGFALAQPWSRQSLSPKE